MQANHPSEDYRDRRRGRVVSHAGSRLLADIADRTTLSEELSQVLELAHRSHVGTVGQRCRGRTQYGCSA